jgi:hypothetical protein
MTKADEEIIGYAAIVLMNRSRLQEFALRTSPAHERLAEQMASEVEEGLKRVRASGGEWEFVDAAVMLMIAAYFEDKWDRMEAFAMAIHRHTGDRFMIIEFGVTHDNHFLNNYWSAEADTLEEGKEGVLNHPAVVEAKQVLETPGTLVSQAPN